MRDLPPTTPTQSTFTSALCKGAATFESARAGAAEAAAAVVEVPASLVVVVAACAAMVGVEVAVAPVEVASVACTGIGGTATWDLGAAPTINTNATSATKVIKMPFSEANQRISLRYLKNGSLAL